MDNPFLAIKSGWLTKIVEGLKAKAEFQANADEGMAFFNGPYDFLYKPETYNAKQSLAWSGDGSFPAPTFSIVINKVSEGVQLFGPALYHTNPDREVTPPLQLELPLEVLGDPNDPAVQLMAQQLQMQMQMEQVPHRARAGLLEYYLDRTPIMNDLETNARKVVDECIIKGMGVFRHKIYTPPGVNWKIAGSFYQPVDDVVMDCDMSSWGGAKWQAIRCVKPVWEVEDEYGLPRGTLKGKGSHQSSNQAQSMGAMDPMSKLRAKGTSNDLLTYWEVYSKMGMGNLLTGVPDDAAGLEQLGVYCKIVVAETVDFPLNLPKEIWNDQAAVQKAVEWDTPFWIGDDWPTTPYSLHWIPGKTWPQSHFSTAMGELKFLNWAYSFIATKMGIAIKDWIAIKAGLEDEVKKAIENPQGDYRVLKITANMGGNINELVQFLQHPPFHPAFFEVVMHFMELFDKRTGLTELMYGQTATQSRSSADSQLKGDAMKIRPDDMSKKLEQTMAITGWKEALMSRWHLEPEDLLPIMGQVGTQFWMKFVATHDPAELVHGLEYRVESGSIRKPNQEKKALDANALVQTLFQPFWQYATMTGDVRAVNAVIALWCESQQLDPAQFILPTPPPVAPTATGQAPPEKPPQEAA